MPPRIDLRKSCQFKELRAGRSRQMQARLTQDGARHGLASGGGARDQRYWRLPMPTGLLFQKRSSGRSTRCSVPIEGDESHAHVPT